MIYTGYNKVKLSDEELSEFYSGTLNFEALQENEYLILEHDSGNSSFYVCHDGKLKQLAYPVLGNDRTGKIKPRNDEQYCAMDLLKNEVPIKLITGKFGSGKTMMMITAALEAVDKQKFEKIIFIRNNVQVRDTDQLGALPGTEQDKMLPYLMPFCDHCGGVDGVQMLIEEGKLEVIPLGFLRGRSIKNSILYSMESENLTKEHIQLIMGRIDEGSQLWMDGDIKQRDRDRFEKSKGLETMIERLKGHENFGYVHLIKSERSEVAAMADLLD